MSRSSCLQWLKDEWLLLACVLIAALLALVDPQPWSHYQRWLQVPTLSGLLALLLAIQGIRDSGMVQHAAMRTIARVRSVRSLGLLLAGLAAMLSMVLTNDVSLFLLVPLTLAIGEGSNLPVLRMVVLEALAVNAGSALSPIGNPQNLLLWQSSGLSFVSFAWQMLPAAAVMLFLLGLLTAALLPGERMKVGSIERPPMHRRLGAFSTVALIGTVVMIDTGLAPLAAVMLLALGLLFARRSLAHVDWALLVTFAALFVAIGHAAELPLIDHLLSYLDFHQPPVMFLSGLLASQVISNVPATVLLLHRASDPIALAVAVNLGGFGLVIGSLANLIALRLARQPQSLRQFHLISVPFLLVCAPLVYLVARWVG